MFLYSPRMRNGYIVAYLALAERAGRRFLALAPEKTAFLYTKYSSIRGEGSCLAHGGCSAASQRRGHYLTVFISVE